MKTLFPWLLVFGGVIACFVIAVLGEKNATLAKINTKKMIKKIELKKEELAKTTRASKKVDTATAEAIEQQTKLIKDLNNSIEQLQYSIRAAKSGVKTAPQTEIITPTKVKTLNLSGVLKKLTRLQLLLDEIQNQNDRLKPGN